MPAAEDVERQIAVAVVVAVEEAAFLMAVQRIVGRIEIEHDLFGRFAMRIEKQIDQQPLDQGRLVRDPTIAVDHGRAELQPVQRALARQGRTPAVPRLQSTKHHAHDRIVPPPIVIDQVFVAECHAQHPLADQGREVVHDPIAGTAVGEACSEPLDQPDRPIRRPEQQSPRIRRDRPTGEIRHHPPPIDGCKSHRVRATLCRHRGALLRRFKSLSQTHFPTFRTPMHSHLVRNPG